MGRLLFVLTIFLIKTSFFTAEGSITPEEEIKQSRNGAIQEHVSHQARINPAREHQNQWQSSSDQSNNFSFNTKTIQTEIRLNLTVDQTELFRNNNFSFNKNAEDQPELRLTLTTDQLRLLSERSLGVRKVRNVEDEEKIKEGLKYQLPKTIIPKHYAIKLTPHIIPGNFSFDGFVEITTLVLLNTTEVVLHIANITYESMSLESNGSNIPIINTIHDKQHQFLRIHTTKSISSGSELIIRIKYKGYLNEKQLGFYRNYYIDNSNQTKWFVVTKLVPLGARRVFPCFDEPALRATFQLNVSRTGDFKAVSINELKSTVKEGDRYVDIFEKSPVMPTYSMALIISNFSSAEDVLNEFSWAQETANHEIIHSFISRHESRRQLEQVSRLWSQLENWDFVVYNKTTLITNPEYVSIPLKKNFANNMVYQTAHEYYGYEISPHWWKDMWLNTGIDQYYTSTISSSKLNSNWNADEQFIVDWLQPALVYDARPSRYPLSHDVYSPSEITNMFSTIAEKSGSIFRMIKNAMTNTFFINGINDYYFNKKYQSATPDDLYFALQTAMTNSTVRFNASIKTIMDSWVSQAGYPVVHVKINKGVATISQERFLSKNPHNIPINQTWWIPITWTSSLKSNFSKRTPQSWLNRTVDEIAVDEIDNNGWIIFNIQQTGFYRVNYDNQTWAQLVKILKSKDFHKIHPINRAALLDDLFNLALAGYVEPNTVISAAEYLTQETNYIPWKSALNNFAILETTINNKNILKLFQKYVLKMIKPIYDKIGFEEKANESYVDLLLRMNILEWACKYGNEHCLENSFRIFNSWKYGSQKVPVNLRPTVYCTAVKYGPPENFDFLVTKYQGTIYQHEKEMILTALQCRSQSVKTLNILLKDVLNKKLEIKLHSKPELFNLETNDTLSAIIQNVWKSYSTEDNLKPYSKMIDPTVRPLKYNIYIQPDLQNSFTFDGKLEIFMYVIKNTSHITLYEKKLKISEVTVTSTTNKNPIGISSFGPGYHSKFIIYLNDTLVAGSYCTIFIKYTGIIDIGKGALYRTYWKDTAGRKHWIALTQFHRQGIYPTFPIFNKPAFNTKFELHIGRPDYYRIVTSLKLASSVPAATFNGTWDNFKETKDISHSDLFFSITDEGTEGNNTNVDYKVHLDSTEYIKNALETKRKALNFLKKYTGISNSIENLDLDVLNLEIYDEMAPTDFIRDTDMAIINKLVKMWFNETITAESDNEKWIDGFAKYFKWFIMNNLQPKARLMDQYIVYELQEALIEDNFKAEDGKIASLIHMIENTFGKDEFQAALQKYLQSNQTELAYLWKILGETVVHDQTPKTHKGLITTMMSSWVNQSGYPVVDANYSNKTLTLRQERFLITGRSSSEELYWIPITIATKSIPDFSNTSPVLWLESKREIVANTLNITDEWFILNVQQTGFYRVNYDEHSWTLLIDALNSDNFGGISEINRAQIIDDLLNLARADYISYDLALNGTQYLSKEKGHLPWKAFLNAASFLYDRFDGQDVGKSFKEYILQLIAPIYEEVGFEERNNDSQMDKLNRNLILSWACKLDHHDCVDTSKELFKEWRERSSEFIPSNAKQTVLCTAVRHGSTNNWKFLWDKYLDARAESEKITILNALGCSKEKKVINMYFDYVLNPDSPINSRYLPIVFASVYSSGKFGVDATFNYLQKNYHRVYQRFPNKDSMAELFSKMASKLSFMDQVKQLELFKNSQIGEIINIKRSLDESISSTMQNVEWYNKNSEDIDYWLLNNGIVSITSEDDDEDDIWKPNFHNTIQTAGFADDSPTFIVTVLILISACFVLFVIGLYFYFKNNRELAITET